MNGLTSRLETARQIFFRCGVRQIIETGTFRGTTTEWFAKFDLPVYTIESYRHNYEFAKLRLREKKNVHVEFGNSAEVLPILVATLDTSLPTFIYLDAHWEDYLPLREEISFITANFKAAVILIDDFQVPGDPGYVYDDYGPGKALDGDYLKTCWADGMKAYYPSTPAAEESGSPTGSRSGWVVLTTNPEMAAALDQIQLLRPA
jgi:hypothetical protein